MNVSRLLLGQCDLPRRSARHRIILQHVAITITVTTLLWSLATECLAIRPNKWIHDTEDDYSAGKPKHVVVTNLGDVKLAAATTVLAELPEHATIIYDLERMDNGDLYLAVGPEGKLLCRRGDSVNEVLSVDNEQIFCLDLYQGHILVGVSGDATSRLALLDNGQLKTITELTEVRYVWDLVVIDDKIYAATGTKGQLLEIDLSATNAPKVRVLLDAVQDNLLCLECDAKGRLYTGSDGDGLIYRVTIESDQEARAFVLLDAQEAEIATLVVKPDGTVYAGTADANQAKPNRMQPAVKVNRGRPKPVNRNIPPKNSSRPLPESERETVRAYPGDDLVEVNTDKDPSLHEDDREATTQQEAPSAQAIDNRVLPYLTLLATNTPDHQGNNAHNSATLKQVDSVREAMHQRLLSVRQTSNLNAPAKTESKVAIVKSGTPPSTSSRRLIPQQRSKKGNAIYKISSDGFVEEVFRDLVMILQVVDHHGALLVGTGNEGQLYRVDIDTEETTILADLEPQQLPVMVQVDDGVLIGSANPATLLQIDATYATKGTYTSKTLDAIQTSLWGRLHLTAQTPPGTAITIETRSGNVEDPDQAVWSKWSKAVVLESQHMSQMAPRELEVTSPPARFCQYRLTLESDGSATAIVDRLDLAYVTPNLRPRISSITTKYGSGSIKPKSRSSASSLNTKSDPVHESTLRIEWQAADPNNDQLSYDLQYQPDGSQCWLPLAEDLQGNRYFWQTNLVPDGRYTLQLRASDRGDNTTDMELSASRHSDPIVVDNTPPIMEDLHQEVIDQAVRISGIAIDAISVITNVQYIIDGEAPWRPVLPKDLIFDSTRETFVITINGLETGSHVIALRVVDTLANVRYEQVLVELE